MTAAVIFVALFILAGIFIVLDDGNWDRKK